MRLEIAAHAKLNLDLQVIGKRPDGYHDIRTTMQTIELHDLLSITEGGDGGFTTDGMRVDKTNNSVRKAHEAMQDITKRKLPATFHLTKHIPPGSGMGGASSDAAAALKGLRKMFNLDIDLDPIAAAIGSDVPFFLHGGRARVEGRGERVTPLPPELAWFAIAWPQIELSTQAVYKAWDEVNGPDLSKAAQHVEPRLTAFTTMLGDGWRMTGSGSAFFKQTTTENEAKTAIRGLDCWTTVTTIK